MLKERMLKIEEVALSVGVSTKTIRNWYKFKRQNPDNELCNLLPEVVRENLRKTMYWKQSDVWKLMEFKKNVVVGRNGSMGSVTQKYVKKKENGNEKES